MVHQQQSFYKDYLHQDSHAKKITDIYHGSKKL